MRFCGDHWQSLKSAIEARGMGDLIAKSGQEAHARAVSELEGRATDATFDPLMAAHWMITGKAIEMCGLGLMTGEYCPVCELLKVLPPPPEGHRYATNDAYLIDGPADAVLENCRELKLVH